MKGAEQYVRETDLSRKVAEWQGKLAPILKTQVRFSSTGFSGVRVDKSSYVWCFFFFL